MNSDGVLAAAGPAGAKKDLTPKSTRKYAAFMVSGVSYEWISTCFATTPKDRTRLDIGVGEEVDLQFQSPLKNRLSVLNNYTLSGGGSLRALQNDGTVWRFTAPSNGASPKITFSSGTYKDAKTFNVVEPTGIDHANFVEYWSYSSTSLAGAGVHLRPFIGPTNVSFYRVQVMEVGENASNVSGYFTTNNAPSHDYDHGANHWISLGYDNSWPASYDVATSSGWSPPWAGTGFSGGSYTWDIPARWKIGNGSTNSMTGWNQVHTLLPNGTMTVSKFGHSVSRTIQNVYSGQ